MGAGHAHALYVHEHSPLHRMSPQVKIASTVAFVVIVALTPRETVWAFGIYAGLIVAVAFVARISIGFVLLRLLGIVPFVAFAFLIPFIASGDQIEILGMAMSRDGLWAAWNIVAKASIGATASIVLVATTEVADLLGGLGRLRVPAVLTAIAGFMIRYLEVIAGEIARMRVAMTARGYDPRWLWQARPIAASAGTVFVRSYERGERVYDAMVARGFDGTMPDLRGRETTTRQWLTGLSLPAIALIVAVASWWVT